MLKGVAPGRAEDLVEGGCGGVVRLDVEAEVAEAGAEARAESVFSRLSSPCLPRWSSR